MEKATSGFANRMSDFAFEVVKEEGNTNKKEPAKKESVVKKKDETHS